MFAILNHVVDNSPISIEKKYIDANGDCNPHRILVKHNHLELLKTLQTGGAARRMGGRQIAQTRDNYQNHVMQVTIVTKNNKATRTSVFVFCGYVWTSSGRFYIKFIMVSILLAYFPSSP